MFGLGRGVLTFEYPIAVELEQKRQDIQKELVEVEERLKRDLERALEEKPSKEGAQREDPHNKRLGECGDAGDSDEQHSEGEEVVVRQHQRQRQMDDEQEEEGEVDEDDAEEEPRPRLVSQVVKSQVEVSLKNVQAERRHVLQSAMNRKMIISVVNNTYEGGGGGGGRRF